MNYLYDSYSPIKTTRITSNMEKAFINVTPDALKWIAENREYGEKERYRYKKELDTTLKDDLCIKKERIAIENIFKTNTIDLAVDKYQNLLFDRLIQLVDAYDKILVIPNLNLEVIMNYWASVEEISNIDNAHAMYLSSNNWDFSVFNDVLQSMESLLNGNYANMNILLSGGEKDIRTAYYEQCITNSIESESDFYSRIISDNQTVCVNGICQCFLFVNHDIPTVNRTLNIDKFNKKLNNIYNSLGDKKSEFKSIYSMYCRLYYLRLAYDTFEYFGYYSFIRHYAIYLTYCYILNKDENTASEFKHFASTYQFSKIKKILGGLYERTDS